MTEHAPTPEFEEKLRLALTTPDPEPGFAETLRSKLSARAEVMASRPLSPLRAAWAVPLGLVLLLILGVLIVGPQRVAAEVQRLFGYIPGLGIVEQNAALRVLEEPVSQSRDGITLTIVQAFLSTDKTEVTYTVEGVPWSAYPHNENVVGCIEAPELRLPNGTLLKSTGGGGTLLKRSMDFPAVPAGVGKSTFVLPCIGETLPGLAPQNWELPVRFIPAPGNLTVMPVIEVSPSPEPQINTPPPPKNPLVLLKVVDTGDNYVLLGEFRQRDATDASVPSGSGWLAGLTRMTDGNGQDVFYTVPSDPSLQLPPSGPGAEPWAYQIGKTFAPPLTITYTGQNIYPANPNARTKFQFDAGTNPQPGQEWTLNQDLELAGHKLTLLSIQAGSHYGPGYKFLFESSDPAIHDLAVQITGYAAEGGGGGPGQTLGKWSRSLELLYAQQPTGKLEIVLSDLTLYGPTRIWQLQWSPAMPQPGSPSLYGISLGIDHIIPANPGYFLIGHTTWTDSRITSAIPVNSSLSATDSTGQAVTLEPAKWQDAGLAPGPGQWLYRLSRNSLSTPLTLRATQIEVEFRRPVHLTIDLRPYGFDGSDAQLGLTWKVGLDPLEMPGLTAIPHWITYVQLGDLRGFKIGMDADPALQAVPFTIVGGLDTSGMSAVRTGGGSSIDEASGRLVSTVLTDAKITFPLVLSAGGATVSGKWETTWNP